MLIFLKFFTAKGTDHDKEVDECICTNDGVGDVSVTQQEAAAAGTQHELSDAPCIGSIVGAFLGGVLLSCTLGIVVLLAIFCRKRLGSCLLNYKTKFLNHWYNCTYTFIV